MSNQNFGFEYLLYADNLKREILRETRGAGVALGQITRGKFQRLCRDWHALKLKITM